MPLPVAHGLLGASIVAALLPKSTSRRFSISLLAGAVIANAADLDFLLVAILQSKTWHRGFTHSISFALAVSFAVSLLFLVKAGMAQFRNALIYGLAFMSHGLLDYLTSKNGGGVALLWPISTEKQTLGWWGLSEVPSRLTPLEILETLALETVLFSLLLVSMLLLRRLLANSRTSQALAL